MEGSDIKTAVKEKYGLIAKTSTSCCGPTCGCGTPSEIAQSIIANDLYRDADPQILENADLGLGCGTPTAFAKLKEGMTVLDLGSGAGIDVFLAAKEVGPTGKVIGIDMTEEMISRAEANKRTLQAENTEFRTGDIENLPVDSESVDVILSNCVINLVPNKSRAFQEMYRVLKVGGTFTVSDIVSRGEIPEEVKKDMAEWAGCVAGALDREEYLQTIRRAGFKDVAVSAERTYSLEAELGFGLQSITVSATK